ncbi:isocitrate/isopropylmalate family dehydrogenase [Bdellovibrio sp. SKB1291214]|uniref:isocitrate/isopropylmalate dehydrogenase family protein n=1 Tax=Bdellovibrio sp. SKB1291214 TaxID=1732569 RepID=UPI000B51AD86|nr:isocitrate/isopropylmalate family dehydrogenase [Bdellovibrio sp. SKB1291214]UYL09564.1 isocitrate/isopropylmalate family dehydrogenase [Bdellovibrio sp. SKB1291214]
MMKLTVIPGDGIGPEIMTQVIRVLKHVHAPFEYEEHQAGEIALAKMGDLLPQTTVDSINKNKLAIKGPTTTPVGGGHKSINVTMRQKFDLYANVRPVRSLPGVQCVASDVNLTIVRENTEDLYAGIERMVDENTAESIKRITRKGSERIARYAYDLAQKTGRKQVAIVHKANIMKMSDGLFLKVAQEVGWQYPNIQTKDVIVDNACMQLVTRPQQFDVIVTENLYGDILSDLCAGLVGGLGVVPGANIGEKAAIFEAVHGSAPDIAGQNKANPTALLQSAVMMLQHVGEQAKADSIMKALIAALSDVNARTGDLGGKGTTVSFTDAIIQKL